MRAFIFAATLFASLGSAVVFADQATAVADQKAAYSISDTDIGTLLDDPKDGALLDKHIPGFSAREQIDQYRQFTLTFLKNFPQADITDDKLKGIQADFERLDPSKKDHKTNRSPNYTYN